MEKQQSSKYKINDFIKENKENIKRKTINGTLYYTLAIDNGTIYIDKKEDRLFIITEFEGLTIYINGYVDNKDLLIKRAINTINSLKAKIQNINNHKVVFDTPMSFLYSFNRADTINRGDSIFTIINKLNNEERPIKRALENSKLLNVILTNKEATLRKLYSHLKFIEEYLTPSQFSLIQEAIRHNNNDITIINKLLIELNSYNNGYKD